jgi:hypothetical protein
MKRSTAAILRTAASSLAISLALLLALAGTAAAAGDDDLPGTALAVGSAVTQAVSAGDVSDVYAVELTAGQKVHVQCDPGEAGSATGAFHLLVPGAASIAAAGDFDELIYNLRAGTPTRSWADYDYIPAKSGTYYLWVSWSTGTLNYSLSVKRTARPALDLADDADDIPGTAAGKGIHTGVVSTLADPDDLYSVDLTAGRTVTLRLIPITPYNNVFSAYAFLNLLDPDTLSLADYAGHALAGLAQAGNDRTIGNRRVAELQYTPAESGRYFVWIDASTVPYGHNFAYQLSISGSADDTSQLPVFSDVAGSPYFSAIMELAKRGIIGGFEDGTFGPGAPVTRQQFAKMIVKTLDLTVTGAEASPFTDVTARQGSDPFYPVNYVAVCATAGITKGATATTFKPADDITRQQLISMVTRAAGLGDPPTDYVPPFLAAQFYPNDHYQNARKAAYAGLLDSLQGLGQGYDFFAASSRGECAQLLFNLLGRR